MWMLLVVGCYLGLLRLARILEYPSCRLEMCEIAAGSVADPSSCTGTLLLCLLVLGGRGVLERIWTLWLFQLTPHFLLVAETRGFLDVHGPHVSSFLIADKFLPEKRSSLQVFICSCCLLTI